MYKIPDQNTEHMLGSQEHLDGNINIIHYINYINITHFSKVSASVGPQKFGQIFSKISPDLANLIICQQITGHHIEGPI